MRGPQGRLRPVRRLIRQLVLVRHGESTWNAEGRLQGQADPPLSARGRAQAAALRAWIAERGFDRVVTSDLLRARETAALLGFPDAEPDPRWREVDVGAWSGRPAVELVEEEPEAYAAWRAGRIAPPGGEAFDDFAARVEAAGRELLDGNGNATTLVVAHGGPIRALCVRLLGLELNRLGGVFNGSATTVESGPEGIRLAAYNRDGSGGEVL